MSITDWIIILLFLGGLIAIGFAFSKKNKDLKDYFLAGKSMPTWLVVFAATGTSISAGTFVGSPELGFNTNLTFIMSCVGAVTGGVVVAALFLPKLYNSRTITIYGYIGDRFGETSKRATSVMFILGQLFTSGSRLFIAAIAVSVIIFGSIHFRFLMYSIVILGVVSTIYTMAGGIKGLLYIDAIQIMLVIGSGLVALIIVFLALHDTMSLSEIFASLQNGMVKAPAQPEYAMAADGTLSGWIPGSKIQLVDPRFRFDVPYNLIGALGAYAFFKVAQFSTDHEFVQRQLTCKSVRKAGVSLVWSQLLAIPIVLIFLLIGTLLYVRYINDPASAVGAGCIHRRPRHLPAIHLQQHPRGRARSDGGRASRSGAVELQLGDQRHGQQFRIRPLPPDPQEPGQGDQRRCGPDGGLPQDGGADGRPADLVRHRHGRDAADQRTQPRGFRHRRNVLLLRRNDGRVHHGPLHQTGQHTERHRRPRPRTSHGALPPTLHLRARDRGALRTRTVPRLALVVSHRRIRQSSGVPQLQTRP